MLDSLVAPLSSSQFDLVYHRVSDHKENQLLVIHCIAKCVDLRPGSPLLSSSDS